LNKKGGEALKGQKQKWFHRKKARRKVPHIRKHPRWWAAGRLPELGKKTRLIQLGSTTKLTEKKEKIGDRIKMTDGNVFK